MKLEFINQIKKILKTPLRCLMCTDDIKTNQVVLFWILIKLRSNKKLNIGEYIFLNKYYPVTMKNKITYNLITELMKG